MQKTYNLVDFAEFLQKLNDEGFEFVVIGGCAVGAYAHMRGETVLSADLDIYTSGAILNELMAWAPRQGINIVKRPHVRGLPVAFLEWKGLEINILTWAAGLPSFGVVARMARELEVAELGGVIVPIADPLDILANKLEARREKDIPHIEILTAFIEEEITAAFESEQGRQRFMQARRYLEVLGRDDLPENLAKRLVELAELAVDFRFLAGRVPTRSLADRVVHRADDKGIDVEKIQTIVSSRFGR